MPQKKPTKKQTILLNFIADFTEKNQYQLLYGNTIGNIEDTLKSLQEHKIDVKRIFTKVSGREPAVHPRICEEVWPVS